MRSKDNTEDDDGTVNEDQHVTQTSHDVQEEDEGKILETEKAIKVKHMDDDEKIEADNDDKSARNDDQMFGLRDLSKDNLLKLLGIMEGEIQVKSYSKMNKYLSSQPVCVYLCNFNFGSDERCLLCQCFNVLKGYSTFFFFGNRLILPLPQS